MELKILSTSKQFDRITFSVLLIYPFIFFPPNKKIPPLLPIVYWSAFYNVKVFASLWKIRSIPESNEIIFGFFASFMLIIFVLFEKCPSLVYPPWIKIWLPNEVEAWNLRPKFMGKCSSFFLKGQYTSSSEFREFMDFWDYPTIPPTITILSSTVLSVCQTIFRNWIGIYSTIFSLTQWFSW